jgi:hypothetical protein
MPTHICETCNKEFKQKGHLAAHKARKNPCKPATSTAIEALVERKAQEALAKHNIIVPLPTERVQTSSITNQTMQTTRTEVQGHGFIWQDELLCNVYGVTPEELTKIKYSCRVDCPSHLNRLDSCDLQIKVTGNPNSVCMGDTIRVFDLVSSGTVIHMTVVMYEQKDAPKKKVVKRIVELNLTNSRKLLFGSITRDELVELDKAVKSVPQKRKPTQKEHQHMYTLRDRLAEKGGALQLRIKCDSTQSRMQGELNGFQSFLSKHEDRIVAQSSSNKFRGGTITTEISSGRRVLKKKAPAE